MISNNYNLIILYKINIDRYIYTYRLPLLMAKKMVIYFQHIHILKNRKSDKCRGKCHGIRLWPKCQGNVTEFVLEMAGLQQNVVIHCKFIFFCFKN